MEIGYEICTDYCRRYQCEHIICVYIVATPIVMKLECQKVYSTDRKRVKSTIRIGPLPCLVKVTHKCISKSFLAKIITEFC